DGTPTTDGVIQGSAGANLKIVTGDHVYTQSGGFTITVDITNGMSRITEIHSEAFIGNADQLFLAQLFNQLVGHAPATGDPFAANSIRALDTSTTLEQLRNNRFQIANNLINSQDALVKDVRKADIDVLGRDPAADVNGQVVVIDPGMNAWVHFLAQSGDEFQMRALLMGSQEFLQDAVSEFNNPDAVDDFIRRVYEKGLGRNPPPGANAGETAGWRAVVQGGMSRSLVALLILESPEGRMNALNKLVFEPFLGRDMGQTEFNLFWTTQSIKSAKVIALSSDEFFGKLTAPSSPLTAFSPKSGDTMTPQVTALTPSIAP